VARRLDRPTGCDYTLPLNTQSLIDNCNPWELRAPGDFFIVADYQGNSVQLRYRVWEDDGNGGLVLGPAVDIPSSVGQSTADEMTGIVEVAVNLTDGVFHGIADCVTIGNIIPSRLTGNSDQADYKDVVLAPIANQVAISNCGSVEVIKELNPPTATVPAGNSFDWTLDRADTTQLRFDGTTSLNGNLDSHLDSSGLLIDLIAGTNYQLVESINGAVFSKESIICTLDGDGRDITSGGTFEVAVGETTTCVITNKENQGTLIVKKEVVNDDGGTEDRSAFTFDVSGPSNFADEKWTLDDADDEPSDPDNDLLDSKSFTVSTGFYNVTEDDFPGYSEDVTDCTNVFVPAGGSETCTIVNDDQPGTLIIKKEVINDDGGTLVATDFAFDVDGLNLDDESFLDDPDEADPAFGKNEYTVAVGTYTATEDPVPSGCTAAVTDCQDVVVANGDTATCTIFNNDEKANPGGSTVQSWVLQDSLTINGLRLGAPDADSATATFRLYSADDCAAESLVGEEGPVLVDGSTASTSVGIAVSETGFYYWQVEYSGDQFNNGFTTDCGTEITQIQAKDDKGGGRDDFLQ
jgi:hypothetical protein